VVSIREVGPRDGFQNEPEVIATDDKVRLVEMLARTGLRRLEVTSFVRADVIPQLADGAEVLARISVPDDVSLSVLIPNERGLDNALALRERFHEVNVFLSATESHNRANVNRSVEESLSGLETVLGRAREEQVRHLAVIRHQRADPIIAPAHDPVRCCSIEEVMLACPFPDKMPGVLRVDPNRTTAGAVAHMKRSGRRSG